VLEITRCAWKLAIAVVQSCPTAPQPTLAGHKKIRDQLRELLANAARRW